MKEKMAKKKKTDFLSKERLKTQKNRAKLLCCFLFVFLWTKFTKSTRKGSVAQRHSKMCFFSILLG